jgi:tol-pal system protein YbgF
MVVLAVIAAAAQTVLAANKEQQQLAADVRILQQQAQQLQNLIGSMNTALAEALKAVNARLDEQINANRKTFADQKLVIDNLSSDLRIVREKVDDSNVRISSLSQEVDALRQALQQQAVARTVGPAESADPAAVPAAPPIEGAAPTSAASSAPPPIAVGTSPTRLYDMAHSNYTSGLYDLAVDGFESFIRSFPKSDMADDAQVNIGNAYLQDGKNEKAVEAYDRAIRTYPGGSAIPDAYYKKGLALMNLKELAQAREAFEYAVKNFPDSAAGQLAKQKLVQLGTPSPATGR